MRRNLSFAIVMCLAAAAAAEDKAAVTPKALQAKYSAAVEKHVKRESKKTGAFQVPDDVLKKEWPLALKRIHKDRIVSLGEGKFFACADFKEKGGKKTDLDLDFYVSKQGDAWIVDRVLVHKVSGVARYTYNDNNERVPIQTVDTAR